MCVGVCVFMSVCEIKELEHTMPRDIQEHSMYTDFS